MRSKKEYTVVTFHTTAAAMAMEEYCHNHNLAGRLIPVPRELSAGCGLAWRMPPETEEAVQEKLKEAGIEAEAVARLTL